MNVLSRMAEHGRRPFLRNILVVMSGTGGAQLVGMLLIPVVTRLYDPSAFGVLGSFTAVVGIIAAGVTLQYSQALMLPGDDGDSMNLLVLSSLLAATGALLCGVLIWVFPYAISSVIQVPVCLLPFLCIAVFLGGQNQTLQAWCVRQKMFRKTSRVQMTRSLAACGTQIGIGLQGAPLWGLVGGTLVGDLCSCGDLMTSFLTKGTRSAFRRASWTRMKTLAWGYRDFPLYTASASTLNAVSQGLPVLLLYHFHGPVVAGAYALGLRILQAPMNLVLTALRQVLFQRFAELHNTGQPLWPFFCRCTFGLFLIAVPFGAVGFIWAPWLFTVALGPEWLEAGRFARWLILWMTALFCNPPAILLARVLRCNRAMLVWEVAILLSRAGILTVGGIVFGPAQTIALFSIVGAMMNIAVIGYISRQTRRHDRPLQSEGDVISSPCEPEQASGPGSEVGECSSPV